MKVLTEGDMAMIDGLVKKLHPEVNGSFYGRVTIELEYKDSVVGKQPYTSVRQSHIVHVKVDNP